MVFCHFLLLKSHSDIQYALRRTCILLYIVGTGNCAIQSIARTINVIARNKRMKNINRKQFSIMPRQTMHKSLQLCTHTYAFAFVLQIVTLVLIVTVLPMLGDS